MRKLGSFAQGVGPQESQIVGMSEQDPKENGTHSNVRLDRSEQQGSMPET